MYQARIDNNELLALTLFDQIDGWYGFREYQFHYKIVFLIDLKFKLSILKIGKMLRYHSVIAAL